jgi:hypothetical protein
VPTKDRTPADRIRADLTAEVAAIRARTDLTVDGRRQHLTDARDRAQLKMRDLARAGREARETEKQEIISRLVANPTAHDSASNHSYRAARAQAAALKTPDEAAKLLAEARMARDGHLERAVAMACLDRAMGNPAESDKWSVTLNEWAQHQSPSVDEALTRLSEIQSEASVSARVSTGIRYALPPVQELAGPNAARSSEADSSL